MKPNIQQTLNELDRISTTLRAYAVIALMLALAYALVRVGTRIGGL